MPKTPQTKPRTATLPAAEGPWPERLRLAVVACLGITLAGLLLTFYTGTHDQFELPKLVFLRLATSVMLALALARLAVLKRVEWVSTPLDWPLLAWSAYLVFKTFSSVSMPISLRGEYENFAGCLTHLNYTLLFFLASQHVRGLAEAERLLLGFVAACGGAALYGIFQALGMDFIRWAASSVVVDRYFGPLGNPNFLGGAMIMALAAVAGVSASGRALRSRRSLWLFFGSQAGFALLWFALWAVERGEGAALVPGRIVTWIAAAWALLMAAQLVLLMARREAAARAAGLAALSLVCFKALLDTGTRGAFLGLLAALAAWMLVSLRGAWARARAAAPRLRHAGLAVALALAAAVGLSFALGPQLSKRMAESLTNPARALEQSRLEIWRPALKIWKDYPLTGSGLDTFKTMFPFYSTAKFAEYDGANVSSRNAHCEPLQVLSTLGLIGLALWLLLLAAAAWAWARRFRAERDADERAALAALFLLGVAYITQNLVSFGVAAISAPFFVALALAFSRAQPKPLQASAIGLRPLAAALALACVVVLPPLAVSTFTADMAYNEGSQITQQVGELDRGGIDLARATAQFSLQSLQGHAGRMDAAESSLALELADRIRALESAYQQAPQNAAITPAYIQASKGALLLYAQRRLDEARRACPLEVKYHVYHGLACEELFKTLPPGRREAWADRARASYVEGTRLNPRNAYYWGNLARLAAFQSDGGDTAMAKACEDAYLKAIDLAPATLLFYVNLMNQYARQGRPEMVRTVAEMRTRSDTFLAGVICAQAGSILLQWGLQKPAPNGPDAATLRRYAPLAVELLEMAERMRPDLAEASYTRSVALLSLKRNAEAREALLRSLSVKPDYALALRLKAEQGW